MLKSDDLKLTTAPSAHETQRAAGKKRAKLGVLCKTPKAMRPMSQKSWLISSNIALLAAAFQTGAQP